MSRRSSSSSMMRILAMVASLDTLAGAKDSVAGWKRPT
jgi:hypothetical protein